MNAKVYTRGDSVKIHFTNFISKTGELGLKTESLTYAEWKDKNLNT